MDQIESAGTRIYLVLFCSRFVKYKVMTWPFEKDFCVEPPLFGGVWRRACGLRGHDENSWGEAVTMSDLT